MIHLELHAKYWSKRRCSLYVTVTVKELNALDTVYRYKWLNTCVCLCLVFVQRVSHHWRERRALLPRCLGMRCVVCAETKHLAFITTFWAVRAVKVSSDAAWSKELSTPARTRAAARWTCTCAASVSSAVCGSAGRQECWNNVSDFPSQLIYLHLSIHPSITFPFSDTVKMPEWTKKTTHP